MQIIVRLALLKMAGGTIGYGANLNSQTKKAMMNPTPSRKGTRTCALPQGYCDLPVS